MCPWPTIGVSQITSSARLTAQTIVNAVNLQNNTVQNSTVVNVSSVTTKSLTIYLTSTGNVSDYLIKVTTLASKDTTAANFAEITSEIYEENGTYHWNLDDSGKYFRVDVQQIGTADASNYVTITVIIEGTS